MLWAFGSSSVQSVEVCQRDLPRRGVRSVLTFPLARTGLRLFRHESLLELSGVPSLACALSPGCSRGMASSILALTGLLCAVHLKWQPGGGGSVPACCPPCASVTSCHTWRWAGRGTGVFAGSFSCPFPLLSDWNCFPAAGGFGFPEVAQQ